MSTGEKVARQLRDAASLLESMADDVAGDIEIGSTDETPTLSVKKDYIARRRLA